jgi:hypothetical protein
MVWILEDGKPADVAAHRSSRAMEAETKTTKTHPYRRSLGIRQGATREPASGRMPGVVCKILTEVLCGVEASRREICTEKSKCYTVRDTVSSLSPITALITPPRVAGLSGPSV